jgi:gamma-glutamyltranspeptidase/glutathione hydrolase
MNPKSGVVVQNRGQGSVLTPGIRTRLGGKRLIHTIILGMAAENRRVFMTFGVIGGQY